jgi:hypothetical protein
MTLKEKGQEVATVVMKVRTNVRGNPVVDTDRVAKE